MCVSCHAEVNIVQVVYTHRVKHFQDEAKGDPSALLIPALLDSKVSFFSTLVLDPHSQPLLSNPGLKPHHQHLSSTPIRNPLSQSLSSTLLLNPFVPPLHSQPQPFAPAINPVYPFVYVHNPGLQHETNIYIYEFLFEFTLQMLRVHA